MALAASLISMWAAISVALAEIIVGAIAGNVIGMPLTPWINYLAGFGAILLTFLAGAEIDLDVVRKHIGSTVSIGVMGFAAPYIGCLLLARFGLHWPWPQAQIAGIALSTTSVAVVYAVMVETGLNRTEVGKVILAACFINDLGTVLALGVVFANYNIWLVAFGIVTIAVCCALPFVSPWFFRKVGERVSEPSLKFLLLILFALGGFAMAVKSEAVLPAYVVGMALAPAFKQSPDLPMRLRVISFTALTPFYFLKAGSLVEGSVLIGSAGLIILFLATKMVTKFAGILPLTRFFSFGNREGMYTTLMMSTGLTFGTISALFGLTNHIIDQTQYTILVVGVIGSAVVPTMIAQAWFRPTSGEIKATGAKQLATNSEIT
ncbi:MAG TPA: cation:proton antiporter [Lacipirellulaceae bacterium]|nr:cation:proton antiporter [Lacipirellulaceae bacterium]